jgi:membrane protease YdiL (CAAX protease family)
MASNLRRLFEAGGLTILALAVTAAVTNLDITFFKKYSALITAACWLYFPIIIIAVRREQLSLFALDRLGLLPSMFWAGLWILITFPLFYIGWGILQEYLYSYHWRFQVPAGIWQVLAFQFLAIAVPEELFFRGYFQGRLDQVFERRWRLWGASIGPGLFIAAAAFAVCHLVIEASLMRLAVFFPAMLMGWMRERTGSILAPVIFHALSNVSFIVAQAGLYQG